MRAKGILHPGCSASTLTLATVRCGAETRVSGNLMELCAVILPANQSHRTPQLIGPIAVCAGVKDQVTVRDWLGTTFRIEPDGKCEFCF